MRGNLWPSLCFADDADLNGKPPEWCDSVANLRIHGTTAPRHHGTTGYRPRDMLAEELAHLGPLPDRIGFAPCLREDRKVAPDGYVHLEVWPETSIPPRPAFS